MQPPDDWLAEHIADVIAKAPPLTPADAALLRGWLPRLTGCPCGHLRDEDCVRHRPIGPPVDWAAANGYDDLLDTA